MWWAELRPVVRIALVILFVVIVSLPCFVMWSEGNRGGGASSGPWESVPDAQIVADLAYRWVEFLPGRFWQFEPDREVLQVQTLAWDRSGNVRRVQVYLQVVGPAQNLRGTCILEYYRLGDVWLLGGITALSLQHDYL